MEKLRTKNWDQAIKLLNDNLSNEKEHIQLSLCYQITNKYTLEHALVKTALALYPTNTYFQQRAQWHQKPWFEKLEPRPAVRMVYNFTPYILPNVALVSCASSGNYNWLVELLESIQATKHYSTIPHCIVDIGLSDTEKNYLTTHFSVHAIKKPDMIYFPKRTLFNEGSRANNCYPFFHEIFPKFEYLCHIETDMWVQEESVFHDIFTLAKHQGFALANLNTGIYCSHKDSPLFIKWRTEYYKQLETIINPSRRYAQEPSLRKVYTDMGYAFPENQNHNYLPYEKGIPFDMGGILVDPWHKKVISSFHIHRYCVYAKENYFVTRPETLNLQYIRVSRKILEHGWKVSQHEIGLRYRTWPHKNKQELFQQLMEV